MTDLVNVWTDEKQGWGVLVSEDDAKKLGLKMVQKVETKEIKPNETKDAKFNETDVIELKKNSNKQKAGK